MQQVACPLWATVATDLVRLFMSRNLLLTRVNDPLCVCSQFFLFLWCFSLLLATRRLKPVASDFVFDPERSGLHQPSFFSHLPVFFVFFV